MVKTLIYITFQVQLRNPVVTISVKKKRNKKNTGKVKEEQKNV